MGCFLPSVKSRFYRQSAIADFESVKEHT